ncbi:MAG TPA: hypothetical protein VMG09_00190 [Bacteroidota bacterium]|nr:hypothetical protein [Bacteroidota bacterium]
MEPKCVHSCKGLCAALSLAEQKEEAAIGEYRRFAEECDYPDVKIMLERLVFDRQRGLQALRDLRALLTERFATIDNISDSFA